MLTLQEMQIRLRDRKLSTVARACDISYDSLWRLARNRVRVFDVAALQRLSDYLEGRPAGQQEVVRHG